MFIIITTTATTTSTTTTTTTTIYFIILQVDISISAEVQNTDIDQISANFLFHIILNNL